MLCWPCVRRILRISSRRPSIEYPTPRYNGIVMMNPASFDWKKDKEQNGIARKILGDFTERHSRVGFIRIDKGATYSFGRDASAAGALATAQSPSSQSVGSHGA